MCRGYGDNSGHQTVWAGGILRGLTCAVQVGSRLCGPADFSKQLIKHSVPRQIARPFRSAKYGARGIVVEWRSGGSCHTLRMYRW
jgi:hypothetical protein